jgi:Glycosyltransferase family 28 C-terminal domain
MVVVASRLQCSITEVDFPNLNRQLHPSDVLLLALGGDGTLGHQTVIRHVGTGLRAVGIHPSLVVESSLPSHFGDAIVCSPPPGGSGSFGGRLITSRLSAIQRYVDAARRAVVFNTFFCSDVASYARSKGLRCILVTNRYRDTWQAIFDTEGYFKLFDKIITLAEPYDTFSVGAPALCPFPWKPAPMPPTTTPINLPVVLGLVGGGGLPSTANTIRLFREALVGVARDGIAKCTLVRGPYAKEVGDQEAHNFSEVASIPEVAAKLRGSDLVVTEAGYGAVWESVLNAVPSILVPSFRNTDNQELRAYRVAQLGCAVALLGRQRHDLRAIIEDTLFAPGRLGTIRSACHSISEKFRHSAAHLTADLVAACGSGTDATPSP